jgi:tetratricopeptide (TPR) repeat protein
LTRAGEGRPPVSDTLERAIRLREAGEFQEARTVLLKLLEGNPDDAAVAYQCAWVHDRMGREREAITLYERAISLGLSGEDLEGVILSLGSSHRVAGDHEKAAAVLREGVARFPQNRAMEVFLAMALHDLREHAEAMAILLRTIVATSSDAEIASYKAAIAFYADSLHETP